MGTPSGSKLVSTARSSQKHRTMSAGVTCATTRALRVACCARPIVLPCPPSRSERSTGRELAACRGSRRAGRAIRHIAPPPGSCVNRADDRPTGTPEGGTDRGRQRSGSVLRSPPKARISFLHGRGHGSARIGADRRGSTSDGSKARAWIRIGRVMRRGPLPRPPGTRILWSATPHRSSSSISRLCTASPSGVRFASVCRLVSGGASAFPPEEPCAGFPGIPLGPFRATVGMALTGGLRCRPPLPVTGLASPHWHDARQSAYPSGRWRGTIPSPLSREVQPVLGCHLFPGETERFRKLPLAPAIIDGSDR